MNKQERAWRLAPNGVPRLVRCYDNGGETADRYTVLFTGVYRRRTGGNFISVCMSANPYHPQGVGMHAESPQHYDTMHPTKGYQWPPAIGRKCHLGVRIKFEDLPENCQRLVMDDYRDIWNLNA